MPYTLTPRSEWKSRRADQLRAEYDKSGKTPADEQIREAQLNGLNLLCLDLDMNAKQIQAGKTITFEVQFSVKVPMRPEISERETIIGFVLQAGNGSLKVAVANIPRYSGFHGLHYSTLENQSELVIGAQHVLGVG